VHLVFDIFQGIGIAAAVGIRPFLPALVAGGLAAGDVEIHFSHTSWSFLQSAPFLLVLAVLAIGLAMLERRLGPEALTNRGPLALLTGIGAALGALFFAGSLARGHYAAWPGLIAGVACAGLAFAATAPLLARVRAGRDQSVARTLPIYVEGFALLLAGLSVVAPPVGVVGLALLLWLLISGRKREGQKYAGLRILR
jgi:hypothetical protein